MQVGKKVICVNDKFEPWVHTLYRQLPKKDEVYTVRQTSMGRERFIVIKDGKHVPGGASEESVTVKVLLEEIKNDPDPRNIGGEELGFSAERFRELEEESATEERVEELVAAGGGEIDTSDDWKKG